MSKDIDLDLYYVYDRSPQTVSKSFEDILSRHIESGLPKHYLLNEFDIKENSFFIKKMFSRRGKSFRELVRAGEGVARDLLNIFGLAYFECIRNNCSQVESNSISVAARQWFHHDKEINIEYDLRRLLRRIVHETVNKHGSHYFLLKQEYAGVDILQRLLDKRVIHLIVKGYADHYTTFQRYNIYSLDYGLYLDIMETGRFALKARLQKATSDHQITPYGDKRKIKRIVLDESLLQD
jgi:hypothetical protein